MKFNIATLMTRVIAIVSLLIMLSACKRECRVVKETYDGVKEQVVYVYPDCKDSTHYIRQHFYENGQMSSEGFYRNGVKEGKFKSWAVNGNQTAAWEVLDGKEHGLILCWYDNGKKKSEMTLNKGIDNGPAKFWYESGKPESQGVYENGKREGTWKYWDEDGSWRIRNYINDTMSGYTFEYFIDSGAIELIEGQYDKGKEVGTWKVYNQDTVLEQTATYHEDGVTTELVDYFPSGKIKSKGNLVEGSYQGKVVYYNEDGVVIKTEFYKEGKLQRTK